jgi:hypothetical protein
MSLRLLLLGEGARVGIEVAFFLKILICFIAQIYVSDSTRLGLANSLRGNNVTSLMLLTTWLLTLGLRS